MKVDILLRKDQVNTKQDNKDVWILKEELWTRTTAEVTMLKWNMMMENSDLLDEIRRNNTKKCEVEQELKKWDGLAWEQNRITYMNRRVYILNNKKLKEWILQENHNPIDVGHPGQQRMMELVKKNYWWPGLKEDIKKYIQGCFKCQQNKV